MKQLLAAIFTLIGLAGPALAQAMSTVPGTYGPVTVMPPPVYEAPRVPNAPPRLDTFQDRATRCVHFGASQGVPPDKIGQYTRECVNAR